jgi:hypothetical protein
MYSGIHWIFICDDDYGAHLLPEQSFLNKGTFVQDCKPEEETLGFCGVLREF